MQGRSQTSEQDGGGGGGGGLLIEPSWVFDTLPYFETILPSAESLWSSLQDEVYFMGGGRWRHHLGFYQELEIR